MSISESFVPEADDNEELDKGEAESSQIKEVAQNDVSEGVAVEGTSSSTSEAQKGTDPDAASAEAAAAGFEQRYLADQWIARYPNGPFLKFVNSEWKEVPEDETDLIEQLWYEYDAQQVQVVNGVKMKWNEQSQQWLPMEEQIDEDFIAAYQASYGVDYDYSKIEVKRDPPPQPVVEEEKEKAKGKKGTPAPQGWVDMSDNLAAVYVTNLPLDIDEQEFHDFMAKCGVIQVDPRINKPKVKLYRDEEGNLKGDGRCCYIKKESVDLALSLLDGALFKSCTVHVETAHFEPKGDYDPKKKKRKLTAQQKKRFIEQQNRIFEWRPEKPRNYRPKSDCTVIIKGIFTLEEMQKNAALLLDLKEEFTKSCSKYGTVKKVTVYDNNPDGVVGVTFTNTEESDLAVKMMHNRIVDGKLLTAFHWDGKTKYQIEETEEEKAKRLSDWNRFIEEDESTAKTSSESEGEEEKSITESVDSGETERKKAKIDPTDPVTHWPTQE